MAYMDEHGPEPQTRDTIREWDRRAIEEFAIPAVVLMENAGGGAARIIRTLAREKPETFPEPFLIGEDPYNIQGKRTWLKIEND